MRKGKSLVFGRYRRAVSALAATVLFVTLGSASVVSAGSASAGTATQKTYGHHHRPHFIHPSEFATSSRFFPLHVPVAGKKDSIVKGLAVTSTGTVTGGVAKPAATPEVIPTGVTFSVNSTADVGQVKTAGTACKATVSGSTVCTLRAAVEATDNLGTSATPTPATIDVPSGTYTLVTGELFFYDPAGVTVNGAGSATTTIKSNGNTRVIYVTTSTPLALSGLTVTGGVATEVFEGEGVKAAEPAGHVRPHVDTNGGCGGGIFQGDKESILELNGVTVTGNKASDEGGGLCASGTVYATDASFTNNTVHPVATDVTPCAHTACSTIITTTAKPAYDEPGIDALGGGIVLGYETAGAAIFNGVTISGNTVDTSTEEGVEDWFGAGGGLAALYGSYVTITSSSVNGNKVTSDATHCATATTETNFCGMLVGGGLFDVRANVAATGTSFDTNAVDQTGRCADYCHSDEAHYGALGGGIANIGGTDFTDITVDGNTVSTGTPGNTSMNTAEGGGIDSYDPMVLTNSTVDDNTAVGADDSTDVCSISGGAGVFVGSTGFVMSGTTVSGNKLSDGTGAGVVVWTPDSYNDEAPIEDFESGDALSNDVITDNSSTSSWTYANNPAPYDFGSGGGLYVEDGNIQISGLTIDGNSAATWSGGLWVTDYTTANVVDSTIADNTAYQAGGVQLTYDGDLDATNSTIADNAASGTTGDDADQGLAPAGGGIYVADYYSGATLTYDTVSGNTTATTGGGIFVLPEVKTAAVTGAVSGEAELAYTAVRSTGTIIAGNSKAGGAEQDCASSTGTATVTVTFPLESGGWNLAGDASCNLTQPTDQVSVTADLAPLADNGGPAPTMEPYPTSPAVTAGGGPVCPATDERGVARPQGKYCDVGAVEVNAGYWLAGADGGVFALGGAPFLGAATGTLDGTGVGIAATPDGAGYWVVTSQGGVTSFGDAVTHGSMAGKKLNAPIVGIAATKDGGGYWLVGSDGGVFAFGNAKFHTSEGGKKLNAPIVGIAATPTGGGYWLVGADGGVYNFGNAKFYTSMGGQKLNAPIVGIAATPTGGGYWLAGADGGVFAFGKAVFQGCWAGKHLDAPIVGITVAPGGNGYWLAGGDGGVFSFNAPFEGSLVSYGVTAHDVTAITTA